MNRFDHLMEYIFPLIVSTLLFFGSGVFFACEHFVTSVASFAGGVLFFQVYVKERHRK